MQEKISFRSMGFILSLLSAIALTIAALGWLLNSQEASVRFGIPITDSSLLAYAKMKGLQDLLPVLLWLVLIIKGYKKPVAYVMLVALLIPVLDMYLVYSSVGLSSPGNLLIHIPYLILPALSAWFLFKN